MPRGCEWGAREDGSRLRADTAGAGAAAGTDAGARADETETDAAGGTVGAAGTDGGARADAERVRQAAAWAWGAGGMATVMEAGDGTDEGKVDSAENHTVGRES